MEPNKCDICSEPIVNGTSIDICITRTKYDEDGEVVKTIDDVSDITDWDYVVIGECCATDVKAAWGALLTSFGI